MHEDASILVEILTLLGAAVLLVPLATRLRLSPILGYLAAGAVLGPWGLGLIADVADIRHIAEFGIVFLLFIIGIEMKPARLWLMRRQVFGLGGAQVMLTGALLGGVLWGLGVPVNAAIIAGLGLALSSTAMGLQILAEQREIATPVGRAAFAILLLQDLMVPLLLTLIPLLAQGGTGLGGGIGLALIEACGMLAAAVFAGRFLLRPLFRLVAGTRSSEVFTASALLVVLGMAMAMDAVGLSMALGAFLAGLLLADSEFRHQVEADIQPFRGLLLGLFFMAVGMSVDFGLLVDRWLEVLAAVLGLMLVKMLVLAPLARLTGMGWAGAVRTGALLSQGGEFAFVLFSFAAGAGAIDGNLAQILILVVSLSMVLTPLATLGAAALARHIARTATPAADPVPVPAKDEEACIIIAGFGRVGQTVAVMVQQGGRPYIAFDLDLDRVRLGRERGFNVFYGDASRPEVLRAARAEHALLVVVTMDDQAAAARTVSQIHRQHPHLPIHCRARDLAHSKALRAEGATSTVPETLEASLQLGGTALASVGCDTDAVTAMVEAFRQDDYAALVALSTGAACPVPLTPKP